MVNVKLISAALGIILLCMMSHYNAQVGDSSSALPVQKQDSNGKIQVGEDRLVSTEKTDFPLIEPHLAVNPKNPNNLLAGSIVVTKPDLSGLDCATFTSLDGGQTWKRRDFGLATCADPWIAFMLDGTAVFSVLETTASGEDQLLIYRSKDGGQSWADKPVNLGAGHDHQTFAVDTTGKQFAGSLYIASGRPIQNKAGKSRSAVYVARSTDGGASFQKPEHVISSNLSYGAQSSVVLSDGTLLVNFADFQRRGDRRRLESPREWLVASTDGGKTFSESLFISETCDTRVGWSSLAVDASNSKFRDRVYHICGRKQFAGLQISYSDNQGEKWSDPIRIDREGNFTPYIKNPTMAINKDGIVGIAWYDARNDPSGAKSIFRCQEIYFTISLDGGQTFLPETKVSSQRSCPLNPQHTQTALRFPGGGDYMGLVATPDGAFHIMWADSRTGTFQLRTSTVKVNTDVGAGKQ
jgi:hypothetical protein